MYKYVLVWHHHVCAVCAWYLLCRWCLCVFLLLLDATRIWIKVEHRKIVHVVAIKTCKSKQWASIFSHSLFLSLWGYSRTVYVLYCTCEGGTHSSTTIWRQEARPIWRIISQLHFDSRATDWNYSKIKIYFLHWKWVMKCRHLRFCARCGLAAIMVRTETSMFTFVHRFAHGHACV